MKGVFRLLVLLILGLSSALAFAPYRITSVMYLVLILLVFVINNSKNLELFLLVYWWAFWYFLGNVFWIYYSLHDVAQLNIFLSVILVGVFPLCLAVFPAVAIFVAFNYFEGGLRRILALSSSLTLSELIRANFLTGFDWASIGYSQISVWPDSLSSFLLPFVGIYGLSFVTVLIASSISELIRSSVAELIRGGYRFCVGGGCRLIILPLVILSLSFLDIDWIEYEDSMTVSLVQGNIAQSLKFDEDIKRESDSFYLRAISDERSELIVLPETAFTDVYSSDVFADVKSKLKEKDQNAIIGIFDELRVDGEVKYFNSAVLLPDDTQRYAKQHLVPFGEYIPLIFPWFFKLLDIPMSNLESGFWTEGLEIQRSSGKLNVAVNICYENGFNDELMDTAARSNLMVNISNLAWFGNSSAQFQHLQISQARAMEFARPLISATNTGLTAFIDHKGNVNSELEPFTRDILRAEIQTVSGLTPFARAGNLPIGILSALILFFLRTRVPILRSMI